jgi:hypothetical protein
MNMNMNIWTWKWTWTWKLTQTWTWTWILTWTCPFLCPCPSIFSWSRGMDIRISDYAKLSVGFEDLELMKWFLHLRRYMYLSKEATLSLLNVKFKSDNPTDCFFCPNCPIIRQCRMIGSWSWSLHQNFVHPLSLLLEGLPGQCEACQLLFTFGKRKKLAWRDPLNRVGAQATG